MGGMDVQKIGPNGPNRPSIQKRDHARTGVSFIGNTILVCGQTAFHSLALKMSFSHTISVHVPFFVGIGTTVS